MLRYLTYISALGSIITRPVQSGLPGPACYLGTKAGAIVSRIVSMVTVLLSPIHGACKDVSLLPKWSIRLIVKLDYSLYLVIIRIDKTRGQVEQSVQ